MTRTKLIWLSAILLLALLVSVFLFQRVQRKAEERIDILNTCEQGKSAALEDITKGKLSLILGGLGIDEGFAGEMENKYNIRIYRKGCFWLSGWDCYNGTMATAIRTKFGINALPKGTINEEEVKP